MYRLGKYQLTARLGTGGMAEVWRARRLDEPDAPAVVVKRVLPGLAHDPAFARSLRTEARALAQLRHAGIVRLHALEEIEGQLVLVLEHVDGCDLRTLVKSLAAPPPPGFGAFVVAEVCGALAHAHRFAGEDATVRAILHRDVSPSNVMITRDGEVKLVDFGIAKALFDAGSEETRSRSIKGKLSYMAPEQLAGEPLGCAADVYSAGVLLHELLTGQRLFTIASPLAMSLVHEAKVAAPSSVRPAVPAALDAVCLRALERAPSARFADGHEMAEALAPIVAALGFGRAELCAMMAHVALQTEPTAATATVPAALATARPRPRRRRALWAALAALPLCAAIAWMLWPRARVAPPTTTTTTTAIAQPAPSKPSVAPPVIVATPLPVEPPPVEPATRERARPADKSAHKKPHPRPHLDARTLAPF